MAINKNQNPLPGIASGVDPTTGQAWTMCTACRRRIGITVADRCISATHSSHVMAVQPLHRY